MIFLALCNTFADFQSSWVYKVQIPPISSLLLLTSYKYLELPNNQLKLALRIICVTLELNGVLPNDKHNAGPQIL